MWNKAQNDDNDIYLFIHISVYIFMSECVFEIETLEGYTLLNYQIVVL